MPIDLASHDPTLRITNRHGEVLPFSRGIMATSLLATGLRTEEAYRLASIVQESLHDGRARHDSDELVEVACDVLRSQPEGEQIVRRWLSWRAVRRSGRPVVIVLGGAPGAGKSTLATRLAVRLEITRLVTTDAIREVLRTVVPAAVLPELHASTFELVDTERADPFVAFDRQCEAVSNALGAVASRLVTENRSVIAEGVHLRPGALGEALADHPMQPVVVERVVIAPPSVHRANLLSRRNAEPMRGGDRHLERFGHITAIQDHLIGQAKAAGIPTMNVAESTALTQDLVGEVVDRLDRVAA